MSRPAERLATYEDLFDLPKNLVGEIIDGRLETHPRPAPKHAWAASRIGGELDPPFNMGRRGPGGWIILAEPELHLDGQILVPDLAGWRRERMPSLPGTAWIEVVPDWVCEIHSPSTRRTDRVIKLPLYGRLGVAYVWFIDPDDQTLEVYELTKESRWLIICTLEGEDEVRQPPFDAISFGLGTIWGDWAASSPR